MMMRKLAAKVDAIIEIDRWQLTGILGAVLVACALSFFAGVLVGKKAAPPMVASEVVAAQPEKLGRVTARDRHLAMADVSPGTTFIDEGLAQPVADPIPNDPTDAARIETHRQLQDFRAAGRRNELPQTAPEAMPAMVPVIADQPANAAGNHGYTLQVAMLESQDAAKAIAGELESGGHPVRVRPMSAQGRPVFRVELGDFKTAEAATTFKGRFERESGYSPMLVPLF